MLPLTSSSSTPGPTALLIIERIRGEFREMPGLTLTLAQAQRLWNVDVATCTEVLSQLVDAGFLCRRPDGAYGRSSDLSARPLRMAKADIQFIKIDRSGRAAAEG
jgi:hypothetical protein